MAGDPDDLPLERSYFGPNGRPIIIHVGLPFRREGVVDWICAYRIDGLGSGKRHETFGVDAIQALVMALTYVSNALYSSEEYERGELYWHDGPGGDLSLPTTRVIADWLRERADGRSE